jgi:serine/threonine protein kinase
LAQQTSRVVNGLYRLGPALISGTVASIFSALDVTTGDPVAILLARPPATHDSIQLRRLLQPMQALTSLLHPYLYHIREVGLDQNECFIVTDLRGRLLRELLNHEALPLERSLEITRQLAHGLSALHARGIYGIDLRPERISIETAGRYDTALIADVGIRHFLLTLGYGAQESLRNPLLEMDPRYTSPEQLQRSETSRAADVYTLGLLLFEMTAGRVPFVGASPTETRNLQLSAPVPSLRPLRGETFPELQSLIEQALTKHPSLRFPTIEAFSKAIEAVQAGLPKRMPSSGALITSPRSFKTAPVEAIKGRLPKPRPTPVPPPASSLEETPPGAVVEADIDPDDRSTQVRITTEEGEEETIHIPGRARLLLGQSERKKVILIKRLPAILGRADPHQHLQPDINLAPYDPKRSITRHHARIIFDGGLFYIEDLKSRNKTWLGELELVPYERQLLRRHDSIQLGLLQLTFEY